MDRIPHQVNPLNTCKRWLHETHCSTTVTRSHFIKCSFEKQPWRIINAVSWQSYCFLFMKIKMRIKKEGDLIIPQQILFFQLQLMAQLCLYLQAVKEHNIKLVTLEACTLSDYCSLLQEACLICLMSLIFRVPEQRGSNLIRSRIINALKLVTTFSLLI